ncbi:MAG: hypothetical protein J5I90_20145 [Caldilineales bacterium]|nr:hypothetical protein [Caldilineales bacterium]
MSFKVFVDDNFHYQDESQRYEEGEYETYEQAVIACKSIVDLFLAQEYRTGATAEKLYEHYVAFGEDPFVSPEPEGAHFSAWDYAKQRCHEVAGKS